MNNFKEKLADFLRVEGIRIYFPEKYHERLFNYVDRHGGYSTMNLHFYNNCYGMAYADMSTDTKDTICHLLNFLYECSIVLLLRFSLDYDYGTDELIVKMKEIF